MIFSRILSKITLPVVTFCLLTIGISLVYGQTLASWVIIYSRASSGQDTLRLYDVDVGRGVSSFFLSLPEVAWTSVQIAHNRDDLLYKDSERSLWMIYNRQTRASHQITDDEVIVNIPPRWSPNSRHVAYVESIAPFRIYLLTLVDDEPISERVYIDSMELDVFERSLFWSSSITLHYLRLNRTQNLTEVVMLNIETMESTVYPIDMEINFFQWSPDGQQLALRQANNNRMVLYDLTTENQQPVVLLSPQMRGLSLGWSPHEVRFEHAFLIVQGVVQVYDLDTTSEAIYYEFGSGLYSPHWSPDGRWLAIVNQVSNTGLSGRQLYDIQLLNLQTHQARLLPMRINNASVLWSPTSDQLIYYEADTSRLMALNIDTGETHPIVTNMNSVYRLVNLP